MAVYPTIAAGQPLTAAILNDMQPEIVYALTAETVTNSATLQPDDFLTVPVLGNASYLVEVVASFFCPTTDNTVNVKTQWDVPSMSTGIRQCTGPASPGGGTTSRLDTSGKFVAVPFNVNNATVLTNDTVGATVWEYGTLNVGPNGGSVTLQWAQNAASATALTREAFSFMRVTRYA